MGRLILVLLLLPSCVMVRTTAEVEGIGTIKKTTVALGSAKIQNASQAIEGSVTKERIDFHSQSTTTAETNEEILRLISMIP